MSKQSFRDLKNEIELKSAEIDEMALELESKNEEINKLKLYSTKLKYEKKNLEDKLDTKIDYDKARIKELEELIQHAIVVEESDADTVGLGSSVKISRDGVESEYKIVGSNEADPFENKISDRPAVGAALIGKKKGDIVHATTKPTQILSGRINPALIIFPGTPAEIILCK